MRHPIDIGHGVTISYYTWREHDPAGLIETHHRPDGAECSGSVLFDLPGVAEAFPGKPRWQVQYFNPLTLAPSLLCRACGHHGHIRDGRWVPG